MLGFFGVAVLGSKKTRCQTKRTTKMGLLLRKRKANCREFHNKKPGKPNTKSLVVRDTTRLAAERHDAN